MKKIHSNEKIKARLMTIAKEEHIKILYAGESGSRGWGFPSPDSDYDVRFIYIRPTADYLFTFENGYDLKYAITDELDIYGWDLRKVLRLLYKSNVTPFIWIQSPIRYMDVPAFRHAFLALLSGYFCRRRHADHYLGLVRARLPELDQAAIGLKSVFYILRSLLAAEWGLRLGHYAPMEFAPLKRFLPHRLLPHIESLERLKAGVEEAYRLELDMLLRTFIKDRFDELSTRSRSFAASRFELEPLDVFFFKHSLATP